MKVSNTCFTLETDEDFFICSYLVFLADMDVPTQAFSKLCVPIWSRVTVPWCR